MVGGGPGVLLAWCAKSTLFGQENALEFETECSEIVQFTLGFIVKKYCKTVAEPVLMGKKTKKAFWPGRPNIKQLITSC
jgi:hypothetical protein